MSARAFIRGATLTAALVSCARLPEPRPSEPRVAPSAAPVRAAPLSDAVELQFPRSPGGTAEVAPDREQNAHFLMEQLPFLRQHVPITRLSAAMGNLADVQLDATLARLAAGLPRYQVRFEGRQAAEVTLLASPRGPTL